MIDLSFWRGKRVFVTGHTGFKGSWLCKILSCLKSVVTGYALTPQTNPSLFEICRPDMSSITGDIRDQASLLAAFNAAKPEIVLHMAAQPLVLESYRDPRYTFDVNIIGTVNLFECIRQSGCVKSVLNITTDKVYLNLNRQEGYNEDEHLCGFDPYSNSKSCSELVTYSYKNAFFNSLGIPVSTARSGNVIGGGDFSSNRLIPDCAGAALRGEVIKIRNPGSVRPYQHVLDTLFAYLLITEKQYDDFGIAGAYNIGPADSDCATSAMIAGMFCGAWGGGAKWESVSADNPHEDAMLTLDCTKIRETLGWAPIWDIERAVQETAVWYKAYKAGRANAVMDKQINEFIELLA